MQLQGPWKILKSPWISVPEYSGNPEMAFYGPDALSGAQSVVISANITAAAWTAAFLWRRSGNKKRTQNVSEEILVLAVCLVHYVNVRSTSTGSVSVKSA